MMKTFSKTIAKLTIVTILFCLFSLPCFAELRRVPAASIVEQGLTAITVDAEGAEDFRYAGLKDKRHTYVGKIKPESKIKFVIGGSLKNAKELPITGRTSLIRMQITAKKGDTVIKTENFRKENMSNVFLNYTVPKDADTLEVIEVFTLANKSKDSKFNQKVTTVNKLILSAREEVLAAALGQPVTTNSTDKKTTTDTDNKKTTTDSNDKKTTVDANNTKDGSGKNTEKTDGKKGKGSEESPEAEAAKRFTRIVSGIAFLVFLAGIGFHFFVKNRKSNKIASDRLARKEQLRLQAIERQKQLKQNNRPEEMQEEIQQADGPNEDTLPQENSRQDLPPTGGPNAAAAAGAAQAGGSNAAATGAAQAGGPNVAAAGAAQTPYCQNCGAPLKANSKFCENCGSKV
ncbi:MAG: zinc-ribbon domain-containing protein [Acidaminococcaceae bacterium]|nr:zinc-ribbon domain-containing protein [Acidaminococcaceae bacterium]